MRREGCSAKAIRSLAKRFFASFVFACVLVGAGYSGLVRVQAAAVPPRIIMYQGRLLNSNGVPVSDATANISFALYDAASAGTCLWSNNSNTCASVVARTVTLTSGLFSEALGDTAAGVPYASIPATVFANNASVYLEVIVNGETLTPRKPMLSAPYAMNSDSLDGFDTSSTGATTGVVPVTDANGNLTITGSPIGAGVSQGSLYINPDAGVVAAGETLFGIAVGGVNKLRVSDVGDVVLAGKITATDFQCTDCIGFAALQDTSSLDAAFTINMGAFDIATNGTGALNFSNTGQVTFAGNIDANNGIDVATANLTVGTDKLIVSPTTGNISTAGTGTANFGSNGQVTFAGNVDANAGLDVTTNNFTVGGANFSVAPPSGNVITAGDVGVNGGDITSSAAAFNFLNANVTTLTMGAAATIFDINNGAVTSTINIGGTSQNGTNTVNIATNSTSPDSVNIGNNNGTSSVSVTGGTAWSIASNGFITTSNDISVNGGDVTSTGALKVTSGGAGSLQLDSGSGVIAGAAGDDFVVSGTTLVAPFSVDESLNEVRIGDGVSDTNDPKITFYASDATNSGTLSFADTDTFSFANGKFGQTYSFNQSTLSNGGYNNATFTANITGTSAGATNLTILGLGATSVYSGALGAGSNHTIIGTSGNVNISNVNSTFTKSIGSYGQVYNQSTDAAAVGAGGFMAGGDFEVFHDSAQTVTNAYGAYASVFANQGVISKGAAVYGEILAGPGAFTTGFGGSFTNNSEGATRYGIFAAASGGATANYAGYFSAALVQVDTDGAADAMTVANAAGDLGISNDLENHGSGRFGDTNGTDDFVFSSAIQNAPAIQVLTPNLVNGIGLAVQRTDDATGTVFGGDLLHVEQDDVSAGTGNAVNVIQKQTGNSIGLRIQQDNVADQTNGAGGTTVGGQALLLETQEAASNDDIMIIRSNGQDVLAIETDGSVLSDNAYSAAGADYAEYFPSTDTTLGFYEMVCSDIGRPLSVKRCDAGNRNIVGVMSSKPGFIGNLPEDDSVGSVLVGMVGQIDTYVNAGEGAIAIGDPISTSSSIAGYGAKARGPVRIIGFALEALSSGKGTIKVLVQPQWYGGDVLTATGSATQVAGSLAIASTTAATATATVVDSGTLSLRGSAWSGGTAQTVGMSLKTAVNAVDDYRLSVANSIGTEVASVNQSGDLAIAGRLYPSDRGASQKSKYIYYDGSSGSGGDFMRTNAAGWATGSYDFAEMFPSPDALTPGEIVVFGDASQQVKRSTGEAYSRTIAGIVSTRPGFLAGENRSGNYPIALAGRVPTKVSTENGAINIGDPLTTSTHPGYAMKATEPGPILGYAAESFSGAMGSIVVYVNVSYYSGAPVEQGPAADNSISQLAQDIENFDTAGTLNFNGGQLLAIGSMTSASGTWRLENDGDFVTSGRLIELVRSAQGTDVETYAATSRQMTVQLSGTVTLTNGHADVRFADVDPSFVDVVDANPTYRALVTPYGATGALYVTNRTAEGFSITESGAASSGVSVDWLVIASRRDYAPTTAPVVPNTPVVSTVSPEPTPVVDSGSGSDASSPSDSSGASVSEITPATDVPAVDSPAPEAVSDPVVDAPVVSDVGSDTVVSDAQASGSSNTSDASTPSADASSGEAAP